MYAANETGAVWALPDGSDLPPGAVAFDEEPSALQLAQALPGYAAVFLGSLCGRVDGTASRVRSAVVGEVSRGLEYARAASAALDYRAAGYPADSVPSPVAAWAINGRSPQEAADNIIDEAEAYDAALDAIRAARLLAKERVRNLVAAGEYEQAQLAADAAVAELEALDK